MTDSTANKLATLRHILSKMDSTAVAVSGGVDSLTLAVVANRLLGPARCEIFHAVSPAVPIAATRRVQALARLENWKLSIIDAEEFSDDHYVSNPVNRCFYCKSNLYASIGNCTKKQIISGTNADDLGEYRPGLQAAEKFLVRHPYVEAGIAKVDLREFACFLGLPEIAALPSSPCLASRVETGIGIRAAALAVIDSAEQLVIQEINPQAVRCRLRKQGIVIELDQVSMNRLTAEQEGKLKQQVNVMFAALDMELEVQFALYRSGSAFIGIKHESI
ncbi:MAG: hypothetical protein ACREXO_01455 [Advenella sp.]